MGLAAGLHAVVRLPQAVDPGALMRAAAARSLGVYPLALGYLRPPARGDGVVLGYANLTESRIEQGVRVLAGVVAELSSGVAADGRAALA